MRTLSLAWRQLRRDLKAGDIRILLAALVLAVVAVASVGFVTDRAERALAMEANRLLGGDALVRGGRLDVGAENGANGTEIVVRAEGPRLVLDPELRTALQGEVEENALTPRAAAAWLVHRLATASGGYVQVSDPAEPALLFGALLGTGVVTAG